MKVEDLERATSLAREYERLCRDAHDAEMTVQDGASGTRKGLLVCIRWDLCDDAMKEAVRAAVVAEIERRRRGVAAELAALGIEMEDDGCAAG